MSQTHAEIRFEKARKRLSAALKNLEEVVKEKLHEASVNATMMSVSDDDTNSAHAKLVEQETVIQKLNSEINNLQKNLSDLGKETEFLNEKNKVLGQRIAEFRTQGSSLIEAIEAELLSIEEVLENHDN